MAWDPQRPPHKAQPPRNSTPFARGPPSSYPSHRTIFFFRIYHITPSHQTMRAHRGASSRKAFTHLTPKARRPRDGRARLHSRLHPRLHRITPSRLSFLSHSAAFAVPSMRKVQTAPSPPPPHSRRIITLHHAKTPSQPRASITQTRTQRAASRTGRSPNPHRVRVPSV